MTGAFSLFFRSQIHSPLNSEAWIIFWAGKNRDGWFMADHLLAQVNHTINIFEGCTNGHVQGLFLFNNTPSHQKRAKNALSTCQMVKGAPFFILPIHHSYSLGP
jgi:hypothetical protein